MQVFIYSQMEFTFQTDLINKYFCNYTYPKIDGLLSDIKNAKLGTGRSSQGIEGYGGGPLWRRRRSANEEE